MSRMLRPDVGTTIVPLLWGHTLMGNYLLCTQGLRVRLPLVPPKGENDGFSILEYTEPQWYRCERCVKVKNGSAMGIDSIHVSNST